MTEELTETIRLAMQWLFAPLLVVAALSLLCVRLETLGVFAAIRSAVRRMSVFQRFATAAFLAVFIVFAGEKTNAPSLLPPILPPIIPPVLPVQQTPSIGMNPSVGPAEPFASPSGGATTNMRWLLRGAFEDALRIPFPIEDGFPWRGGVATALTVFACGELRPNAATEYFPSPFVDPLSLPPLLRHDAAAPSVFWHASTPSNSLIATWENALYGRDAASPTNFQAEFFADGSFIYRYPDHATLYPPVLPFDYDGDGLENSVDPDPEVSGPDAHGTNAQWYNTVCSNILVATEATNCIPPVSLSWLEGVNSNAYYFVDVVATRGPAPICFFDASGRMPDDPVVVARAGETNRVPLVIGVEYAVTSSVPFTVSPAYECEIGRPTDCMLKIEPRDGGGTTVHWPIRFSYVEKDEDMTEFAVCSSPDALELEYSWHVTGGNSTVPSPMMSPMMMPMLPGLLGSSGSCECFNYEGSNIVASCSGGCECGGCTLWGTASHVGHSIALPAFTCGCGPSSGDPDPTDPQFDPSLPSISVSFNAPAVIYEDAYVNAPGETIPKRSTQVAVSVSVSGGDNGAHFGIRKENLGRLIPAGGPLNIPASGTLEPHESLNLSFECVGGSPSSLEEDVKISGWVVDSETGARDNCNGSKLTVFRVELRPKVDPPQNATSGRHTYGVNELVEYGQYPSSPVLIRNSIYGGAFIIDEYMDKLYYQCPLADCQNPLIVSYGAIAYEPLLTIVSPTGIVARNAHVRKYIDVPDGHAGGLGLVQEFHVIPSTVSFSRIAVEEVPSTQSQLTGYFHWLEEAGDPAPVSHTVAAGAGKWFNVNSVNRVGGDDLIEDMVGITTELHRMLPDGSLTTNTAYGWLHGTMIWENPFGWNVINTSNGTSPHSQFANSQTNANDRFVITTNGNFSVSKLGNTAIRARDGRCFLNGNQVVPEEAVNTEGEE